MMHDYDNSLFIIDEKFDDVFYEERIHYDFTLKHIFCRLEVRFIYCMFNKDYQIGMMLTDKYTGSHIDGVVISAKYIPTNIITALLDAMQSTSFLPTDLRNSLFYNKKLMNEITHNLNIYHTKCIGV